jgi:hypothetical protein
LSAKRFRFSPVGDAVTEPGEDAAGRPGAPSLNGTINLRKTHPGLYRATMVFALANVGLGLNFFFLSPTFQVYEANYFLWASVFMGLGISNIVFLNIRRNLSLARLVMALSFAFFLFFGLGTMQPWIEGEGSLQLPILYLALALLEFPLLLEPFINPWTAKGED